MEVAFSQWTTPIAVMPTWFVPARTSLCPVPDTQQDRISGKKAISSSNLMVFYPAAVVAAGDHRCDFTAVADGHHDAFQPPSPPGCRHLAPVPHSACGRWNSLQSIIILPLLV